MSAPAAPPPRAPTRVGPRTAFAGGAVLAVLVAVGIARRESGAPAAAAEPAADFVVAAGDSTYWVTRTGGAPEAGPGDVHVRASALFLARWAGRLSEVYVTDDERAFDDGAWFAAQRVYRRDLLTGDSALVFADPRVPRLAARYAAAHPDVRVLDPDEAPPAPDELDERGDASGDDHAAPPGAEATMALAAAHGPYVSLEERTTGAEGDDGAPDAVMRRVVDLRTAREASLAGLFGPAAAARLAGAGQRTLRTAVARLATSARRAAAGPVPPVDSAARADVDAARRALAALATLRFDPASFGLADVEGAPAVAFVAVGRDVDGSAVTLPLPPVPVPGDPPTWWHAEVAPALLVGARGTRTEPAARWRPARGAYEVRARRVAGATALELVAAGAPSGGAGRTWPLVRVPAGPAQLFALDDPATRRALRRAFDESAFYDDAITSVAWRRGGRARPLARLAARRP